MLALRSTYWFSMLSFCIGTTVSHFLPLTVGCDMLYIVQDILCNYYGRLYDSKDRPLCFAAVIFFFFLARVTSPYGLGHTNAITLV